MGICAAVVIFMLIYYMKRERKLLSFFIGALTGLAALMVLNKYGENFGAFVPLNIFNVSASAVLGVPFVIFLAVMSFI